MSLAKFVQWLQSTQLRMSPLDMCRPAPQRRCSLEDGNERTKAEPKQSSKAMCARERGKRLSALAQLTLLNVPGERKHEAKGEEEEEEEDGRDEARHVKGQGER